MTDNQRTAVLRQASIPTLLMCLAQVTGDRRWLDEPFLPRRDISIFAEPSGGLSPEAQQVVITAAAQMLDDLASGALQLPPPLAPAQMMEMMGVCLGEPVPAEYTTMAMEEMGFADRRLDWRTPAAPDRLASFKVLVVGAGFSGLCVSGCSHSRFPAQWG